MRRTTLSLAALAFVAFAPAAFAQAASPMSKITVDLHANGASLSPEEGDRQNGAGFGLGLGYDVMPALRLTASMDLSKIDVSDEEIGLEGNFGLTQIDIGARYSFLSAARKWTPFLNAAFSPRTLAADVEDPDSGEEVEVKFSGNAFSFGGGFDYTMSPKLAFTTNLTYTMGSFDTMEVDGEEMESSDSPNTNGTRINVGLTWRPFR